MGILNTPFWLTEPMTAEHLGDVLAIERASFANPWPPEGFIPSSVASWARALVLRDRHRPGRVLGYVCYWTLEGEMEIQNIAVRPEDRRAGGAWHLMTAAMKDATERGCLNAWLEVRPTNRSAITLYERWGFRPVGRRRMYYEDGEDAIIMRASLDPSPGPLPEPGDGLSLKGPRSGC